MRTWVVKAFLRLYAPSLNPEQERACENVARKLNEKLENKGTIGEFSVEMIAAALGKLKKTQQFIFTVSKTKKDTRIYKVSPKAQTYVGVSQIGISIFPRSAAEMSGDPNRKYALRLIVYPVNGNAFDIDSEVVFQESSKDVKSTALIERSIIEFLAPKGLKYDLSELKTEKSTKRKRNPLFRFFSHLIKKDKSKIDTRKPESLTSVDPVAKKRAHRNCLFCCFWFFNKSDDSISTASAGKGMPETGFKHFRM